MFWPFKKAKPAPVHSASAELLEAARILDVAVDDSMRTEDGGLTLGGGLYLQAKLIRKLALKAI